MFTVNYEVIVPRAVEPLIAQLRGVGRSRASASAGGVLMDRRADRGRLIRIRASGRDCLLGTGEGDDYVDGSRRGGLASTEYARELVVSPGGSAEPASAVDEFQVLGDHPFIEGTDHLGYDAAAKELAGIVLGSRASAPFTIGIEASWGMGKTSMMKRLRHELEEAGRDEVKMVDFNPWTAREGEILEGLLKTTLDVVDRRFVRRAFAGARFKKGLRVTTTIAGKLAPVPGAGAVVDAFWQQIKCNPAARNELRGIIKEAMSQWCGCEPQRRNIIERGMSKWRGSDRGSDPQRRNIIERAMSKWRGSDRGSDPQRLLVVFVDDLDRCSPRTVLELFEAIKVYMDVVGIVYVVAYDEDVVTAAVRSSEEHAQYRNDTVSRAYMEKIVQLIYRISPPTQEEAIELVSALARDSRTGELITDAMRSAIADWSEHNPRRIKRLLNALILNYSARNGQTSEGYIASEALAMYYPDFIRMSPARSTAVRDFSRYMRVREALRKRREPAAEDLDAIVDAWRVTREEADSGDALLGKIEARAPKNYVVLADDSRFCEVVEILDRQAEPELDLAWRRLGDRLSSASPQAQPTDELTLSVLAALSRPGYSFRTAEGVAKEIRVPVETVQEIFNANPQYVRRSQIPDRKGRPLFAARKPVATVSG